MSNIGNYEDRVASFSWSLAEEELGIREGDPSIVCSADTQGDQAKGQTAMENCLQRAPDINVVYTINEPAAAGAHRALRAAGRDKSVLLVSVDGGCAGVRNVKAGLIAATSQQYPLRMASLGELFTIGCTGVTLSLIHI